MIRYPDSNKRTLRAHVGLALLLLAAFLPASMGEPVTGRSLRSLVIAPSFEEDPQPLAPVRYAWRTSGFVASLQAGGTVWFTSQEGPSARLTFPGAALTSEPRGEGALREGRPKAAALGGHP